MPEIPGRLRPPRVSSAPASPANGEVYYDTTTNQLYYYNGTTWIGTGGLSPIWDSFTAGVTLPAASVTTPSLPQNFNSLLVTWRARSTATAAGDNFNLRVNGLTTAAYYTQLTRGQGSTASAIELIAGTSARLTSLANAGSGMSPNTVGVGMILIPDYTSTNFYKALLAVGGSATNSTTGNMQAEIAYGYYGSGVAVSTLTFLTNNAGNFPAGSRFSVYGVS